VVPNPAELPAGCAFHPRCPLADAQCRQEMPPLVPHGPGHEVACFKAGEVAFTAPRRGAA
jgi:oligopeptide/dipeptide ABC transporter ATP-binding protein